MYSVNLFNLYQFAAGSILFYSLYWLYWELTTGASRRRMVKENGCQPVTKFPQSDPIFGFDQFLTLSRALKARKILQTNLNRFRMMGVNTWQMNILGDTVIITIEPEILKTIQSLNFKHWELPKQRKDGFLPLFGPGIFTTDGEAWHRSREMLRPNFVKSQVGDLVTFESHVDHLIQAIPRDGSVVNLQDLFFRLTMDSATEFLFGESTGCLVPGIATVSGTKFAEHFTRAQELISESARFGLLGRIFKGSELKKHTDYVHEFVDNFVDKGLEWRRTYNPSTEKDSGRYIFLHELVKQTTDKITLRSELLNILLAGRDTTASLLSNVWWELSRRPDVWAKLRAEVDALEGRHPTYAEIKEMKYLRAVLNESLRLFPVVPGNSREAICDTVLPLGGGPDGKSPCFVPKGRVLAWSVYTMHRRKDYFGEDAEEFRPERWETLRPGWEYLPFNGGPRICIGQQFALTEASYTTIRLMQEFKSIESRDPEPWIEWVTLTATGLNGAKMVLTPA